MVEELINGAVSRQYTNGLQRISENQTISGKWTPRSYGYDGMGNVRQLSNLAGSITDNYGYDAFGNVIVSTGSTPNNYLYRGEQYDSTLALQYLRARYYNPVTGRFLSKDSWPETIDDPASLHKYSYAEANPIAGRDPSGLSDLLEANVIASLPKVYDLRLVSSTVNCILDTAAGTLWAITDAERSGATLLSVNIDYSNCGASVDTINGSGERSSHSSPNAAKKPCSVTQRAELFANGVLNLALASNKFAAAAVEIGSSGIGTGLAYYGIYTGAGNLTTGIIQTVGAFSSNPAEFQRAASLSSVLGSAAGLTTIVATNGNITAASHASRFENFALFGIKLSQPGPLNPLSTFNTGVNVAKEVGVPIGCH